MDNNKLREALGVPVAKEAAALAETPQTREMSNAQMNGYMIGYDESGLDKEAGGPLDKMFARIDEDHNKAKERDYFAAATLGGLGGGAIGTGIGALSGNTSKGAVIGGLAGLGGAPAVLYLVNRLKNANKSF